MTAPLLIHFEHLPPSGKVRVSVDGCPRSTVVNDRAAAMDFAYWISGGCFRIIDELGPRQRVKQRRLPR